MTIRQDIIDEASTIIGAKAADEELSSTDTDYCARALNRLVTSWWAKGAHLWTRNSAQLVLQAGQIEYRLGASSTDNATEDLNETTLSADSAQGDTTPQLTDSTGMAIGDTIGIQLDNGTVHWDIVECEDPITVCTGLPSAAASGNAAYFYTTKVSKPLRIPDARRVQGDPDNRSEIEMVQYGRIDYLNLPNKITTGTQVIFYYDPKQDFGELFVWPEPTSTDRIMNFTHYKPIETYSDAESITDFPEEWDKAIIWNLAKDICRPLTGKAPAQDIIAEAGIALDDVLDWDQGDAPVFFQYSMGRGQ